MSYLKDVYHWIGIDKRIGDHNHPNHTNLIGSHEHNNIIKRKHLMLVFSVIIFIGLLVAITQVSSQLLNSTLHSTLHGVPIAYINERAVFTCVVNSNSMAWTSEEYIGAGGQRIPFSSANDVGHTESAINNNQTVAVLVNSTESDTDVVITSELYIRVESTHQLASVKCVNSGDNTDTSIEFLLAGM